MKKPIHLLLFICLSLFAENAVFGQFAGACRDVMASAGGHITMANGTSFEYTLGEAVIATIDNGSNILTQGFHQPEICPFTSATAEPAAASGLLVYPNPSTGWLFWQFKNPAGLKYQWQVVNVSGQLVRTLPASDDSMENSLDCKNFLSGAYFLQAKSLDGEAQFQVPFVKSDR